MSLKFCSVTKSSEFVYEGGSELTNGTSAECFADLGKFCTLLLKRQ